MKKTVMTTLLVVASMSPLAARVEMSEVDDIKDAVTMYPEVKNNLNPTDMVEKNCISVDPNSENRFLISDSLVKNLSCKTLNADNVFSSLQANAFSIDKQWPVQNWPSGQLAQCWSLALSQRRLFYLARFAQKEETTPSPSESREKILDMIKKKDPAGVFQVGSPNMNQHGPIMDAIQTRENGRDFKSEIEARQKLRFFSPGNLGMVFRDRERSESTNKDTMKDVEKNLSKGRLPVIVLRAAVAVQHAVLVKKLEKLGGNDYQLTCYDSNQPGKEVTIKYKNGQFYAPNVVGLFQIADPEKPVGVFLKDDDEMDEIQQVAYKYYKNLCRKIK